MRDLPWERIGAWVAWVVAGIVALYVLTRGLGFAPWATDEPVYRNAAVAIFEYGNFSHNLEHPPLGKYAIGLSIQLFGEPSAWAVRLPSALSVLGAGVLLALLTKRMVGSSIAAFAAFGMWTLLPHPDPGFDVSRLGYLDALMALLCAGALYAAWRWQEAWSRRWMIACGVLVGLAVATKFTAAFVLVAIPFLITRREDVEAGFTRGWLRIQAAALVGIAMIVALLPWLPLLGDLPHALRFAASMQLRDVSQTIEVGGTRYTDGAPFWAQLRWQWDAWPTIALVELASVVLAWWALPRRALSLVWPAVFVPFVVFALGSRTLPHWQIAWQIGVAVCFGAAVAWLFTHARAGAHARETATAALGAVAMVVVVVVAVTQHVRDVRDEREAPIHQIAERLREADVPGGIVLESTRVGVDRALVYAHPAGWRGTYHSAAESQHEWVHRDGGRPDEPPRERFTRATWSAGELTGVVANRDRDLQIASDELEQRFDEHRFADLALYVWIRQEQRDSE